MALRGAAGAAVLLLSSGPGGTAALKVTSRDSSHDPQPVVSDALLRLAKLKGPDASAVVEHAPAVVAHTSKDAPANKSPAISLAEVSSTRKYWFGMHTGLPKTVIFMLLWNENCFCSKNV